MTRFDQDSAECLVFTFKEGLLSAVAHDLKIRVENFEIAVDQAARTVEGRFDATSLRVVCAMRGGKEDGSALSPGQKSEIEGNIARDVLASKKHREVRFVSSAVEEVRGGFDVRGELSLHGKRRAIDVSVRKSRKRWVASATIHQPDFAIRPYSALLGTLKVKADVEVRVVVPAED